MQVPLICKDWVKKEDTLYLIFIVVGLILCLDIHTGELGYDGPLYDGFLHMTDDMLGPSPMHINYSLYVYDGFCI